MQEEILTVVRLPLADISEEVKRRHKLSEVLVDARIEGGALVMYFSRAPQSAWSRPPTPTGGKVSQSVRSVATEMGDQVRRRRAKGRRNRMRTRGWQVVGRIVNSRGQSALVYKPFVEALASKHLASSQEKAIVTQILRANGNRPSAASIEYYWMNTVEYLRQATSKVEATKGAG